MEVGAWLLFWEVSEHAPILTGVIMDMALKPVLRTVPCNVNVTKLRRIAGAR